jgi:hypothetical protein
MHGRHVVVILGHNSAPILSAVPQYPTLLGIVVGSSYRPTVFWQADPGSVSFASTDGTTWTGTRSLPLSRSLNADAAVTLIRRMAIQDESAQDAFMRPQSSILSELASSERVEGFRSPHPERARVGRARRRIPIAAPPRPIPSERAFGGDTPDR